jgi:hypothetical protein
MIITILGSCRQDSLYKKYNVTNIKELISYPHYTKEILEVINYCKYGNIEDNDTKYIFRTPMLNNTPIKYSEEIKKEFEKTELFIIEIASKKYYKYNNRYVHHILKDHNILEKSNEKNKDIEINDLSDEEIENDIIKIKQELNKPIIIVSHISTYKNSKRDDLVILLEKICLKYNIPFINPIKELNKKGYDITELTENNNINHYNYLGHEKILEVYSDFINNKKKYCIHKYLKKCKGFDYTPGLGDFLRGTISILKFAKKYNYEVFIDKNIHHFFSYFKMNSNYIEYEYENQNENINELINYTYDEMYFLLENLFKKNESFSVITNSFYTKNEKGELENWGEINDNDIKDYLKSILQPINIVKEKIDYLFKYIYKLDKNEKYKIIHIRSGDQYIFDNNKINENDLLINYNKILNIINYYNNENNNYILISDSKTIAKKLKNLIPQLLYWDNEKIHIGALNCDEKNLLDTIIDFIIMSKSDEIIGNGSGFSKVVSCIYDIKYSHYL